VSRGEAEGSSLEAMLRRPAQVEKLAPCQAACPAGGDVRLNVRPICKPDEEEAAEGGG